MAMSKRTRTVLIVIGVAVAAYLVYRWYQNRQASQQGTADTTGTGSNLNSLAPELVAGSAGPSSGLSYTPGNTQVDLTLPGGGPSQDVTGNDTTSVDNEDTDTDDTGHIIRTPGPRPRCPGGAHWDPKRGMCVFGTGEGPIPVKKPPPKRRPPPKRGPRGKRAGV